MESNINIHALSHSTSSSDQFVAYLGGLGPDLPVKFYENVRFEHMDKVWIPSHDSHDEKKQKGQWKQEVTFKSSFVLSCAPSFDSQTMSVRVRRGSPH